MIRVIVIIFQTDSVRRQIIDVLVDVRGNSKGQYGDLFIIERAIGRIIQKIIRSPVRNTIGVGEKSFMANIIANNAKHMEVRSRHTSIKAFALPISRILRRNRLRLNGRVIHRIGSPNCITIRCDCSAGIIHSPFRTACRRVAIFVLQRIFQRRAYRCRCAVCFGLTRCLRVVPTTGV